MSAACDCMSLTDSQAVGPHAVHEFGCPLFCRRCFGTRRHLNADESGMVPCSVCSAPTSKPTRAQLLTAWELGWMAHEAFVAACPPTVADSDLMDIPEMRARNRAAQRRADEAIRTYGATS